MEQNVSNFSRSFIQIVQGLQSQLENVATRLDAICSRLNDFDSRIKALERRASPPRGPDTSRNSVTPSPAKAMVEYRIESNHNECSFKYVDPPKRQYVPVELVTVRSTRDFYVHLDENAVEQFQTLLNDFHKKNPPRLATRFFNDKLYCVEIKDEYLRARLVEAEGTSVRVCLVDFGTFPTVKFDQVYHLDERFDDQSKPIFALSCFLPSHWNLDFAKLDAYFKSFRKDPSLKIVVKFYDAIHDKFPTRPKISSDSVKSTLLSNFKVKIDIDLSHFKAQLFSFEEFHRQNRSVIEYSDTCLEFLLNFYLSYPEVKKYFIAGYEIESRCVFTKEPDNLVCIRKYSFNDDESVTADYFTTNISHFYRSFVVAPRAELEDQGLVAFKLGDFYFRGFINSLPMSSGDDRIQVLSIDYGFVTKVDRSRIHELYSELLPENVAPTAVCCVFSRHYNPGGVLLKSFIDKTLLFDLDNIVNGQLVIDSLQVEE